jgi:hypothetical protein
MPPGEIAQAHDLGTGLEGAIERRRLAAVLTMVKVEILSEGVLYHTRAL